MARVELTRAFLEAAASLPAGIQKAIERKLLFLVQNPRHNSLRLERLQGWPHHWKMRVNDSYRILLRQEGSAEEQVFIAVDVGPHSIYSKWNR
jgi:mRNA-degrading endonuclease RelE of RelBE toxin-antitoxin system